jgi:ankyrin repeat protein
MTETRNVTGAGPAGFGGVESTAPQVATVRDGETSLAAIALRLNMDLASLMQANPQIADPNSLKAGQDIRLPQTLRQSPMDDAPEFARSPMRGPAAPLDDPISKAFAKLSFSQNQVFGYQTQQSTNIQGPPTAAAQADIDALGQAAAAGDLKKIQDLIDAGVDINGKSTADGGTALEQAAASGNKAAVELLLKNHADVNQPDLQKRTPIFMAAQNGHPEIITLLRKHGGDPNAPADFKRTPLMEAAAKGDVKSIVALASGRGGADIGAADINDRNALMEAAGSGNPQAVKALLKEFADVGGKDNSQRTALMEAAKKGDRESVKLLLDKMAEFKDGNKDAVQQLLGQKDIDVDAQDTQGRSAIVDAAAKGNPEVVKALLAKGADINLPDANGRTALMEAAKERHPDIVEILARSKKPIPNLDLQDKVSGQTALMEAVQAGDVRAVKALVAAGAKLDVTDNSGDTALAQAQSLRKMSSSMQKEFDEILNLLQPKP